MTSAVFRNRRILVTGANGFIGRNLVVRLNESSAVDVVTYLRSDSAEVLPKLVCEVDAIVHLAGENRPVDDAAFEDVNAGLTYAVCDAVAQTFRSKGRRVPLVLASSTQADRDNPYGRSKLSAERAVQALAKETDNPCIIFRLNGVFGKWCKPNYNSVVATYCHNIARDLPIHIHDPTTILKLVYVDDVVTALISALEAPVPGCRYANVTPVYSASLDQLAHQIRAFGNCRSTLLTERVGTGFIRALYATYVSHLPVEKFSYQLRQHTDSRGVFVEMLKTTDSGQFSYFTANPGVTRGGHYHHTKTEKFLVIRGEALFRFRHLLTNELVELKASGNAPQVVDTIPGWAHDITNVGDDEMLVMLWANENFNPEKQDTVACRV